MFLRLREVEKMAYPLKVYVNKCEGNRFKAGSTKIPICVY